MGTIGYIDGFHEIIFRAPPLPDRKKEYWVDRSAAQCWGAHAPSRAGFGALAETSFAGSGVPCAWKKKIRDDEGVIASTRGRMRSPEMRSRA